ncbi:hydantoinase/oxoprolinase family protein [Pseudomonas sp. MAFF 212408]|uniref:Hydantoinase/oxoprolinase family protein n=1 Tax=Pseudomonas kitaguniensis TaxID=2607908 RepID=A0A5N7KFB0_9PSED|nr:hydantoinase/oxoprolinase family protein [Pseudomonas kitaguniensis]MPR00748.1 hydantoinase/oxoprolinase family protein [Pseudomonas kitaguniensis]
MSYRMGIDVGGTNTDAVLLDETGQVIAQTKEPTTADVMSGIEAAIATLLGASGVSREAITQAMLGTTQCTNAIVERKALNTVAHLRLGAPATLAIPPMEGVPDDLRALLGQHLFMLEGGVEYDGSCLCALNEQQIRRHLRDVRGQVDAISVCGVFSPVSAHQELQVAHWVKEELGDIPVSLSHAIGSIGLLERENASILNAALFRTARTTAAAFVEALKRHQVNAKVYFGQNDGTLMTLEHALAYPILTIASGPTNSIRGASYLAGLEHALIIDVGGTTTDVGMLTDGFPRESLIAAQIGGVRTNFRMPDIASIGLGGGTVVHRVGEGGFQIGPDSVGYRLTREALVFGGQTLTITDIAVAKGLADIGDRRRVSDLSAVLVEQVYERYVAMVEAVIDRMKTSSAPLPVVLVGGGAIILPTHLEGASQIIRPENFGVANAIGVAIAQASGEVELIVSLEHKSLNAGIDEAVNQAIARAICAGAIADSVTVVDLDTMPLAYMPGNAVRIRAKAAGSLGA